MSEKPDKAKKKSGKLIDFTGYLLKKTLENSGFEVRATKQGKPRLIIRLNRD
jgi:hypothetical protein